MQTNFTHRRPCRRRLSYPEASTVQRCCSIVGSHIRGGDHSAFLMPLYAAVQGSATCFAYRMKQKLCRDLHTIASWETVSDLLAHLLALHLLARHLLTLHLLARHLLALHRPTHGS